MKLKISNRLFAAVLAVLTVSVLVLSSCTPTEPDSLNGNVERPTWTVSDNYDYTVSMTAVVKVQTLNEKAIPDSLITDKDVLAAFNGDSCLGIASLKEGLFFLYIAGTEGNVSLRYYSAHYKNLFEAKDAFVFRNDSSIGSFAQPFIPALKTMK